MHLKCLIIVGVYRRGYEDIRGDQRAQVRDTRNLYRPSQAKCARYAVSGFVELLHTAFSWQETYTILMQGTKLSIINYV